MNNLTSEEKLQQLQALKASNSLTNEEVSKIMSWEGLEFISLVARCLCGPEHIKTPMECLDFTCLNFLKDGITVKGDDYALWKFLVENYNLWRK